MLLLCNDSVCKLLPARSSRGTVRGPDGWSNVSPTASRCGVDVGGGTGDGCLDSYRLECWLLVPCPGVSCWGWGLVIGWVCSRGREVGTVWNIDVVPEVCRSDTGCGWWSGVPICPSIVIGGRGDGSNVSPHFESPDTGSESGIRAGWGSSRDIRDITGSSGGFDDRRAPSGRGRRPSLRIFGISRLTHDLLLIVSKEVMDWDRVSRYGCKDSGWELLERDGIDIVGGSGRDCGGGALCLPILFTRL